jgi:two-component system phosphate regulon sensor histidine kinase PhoR
MFNSRLFWRLFITYGVLILGSLALVGLLSISRVEGYFLQQIEDTLQTRAKLVRIAVCDEPNMSPQVLQERVTALAREIETHITLLGPAGEVLADSDKGPARIENEANPADIQAARDSKAGAASRFGRSQNRNMMYVALDTRDRNCGIAFVRVGLQLDAVEEKLAGLRRLTWTAAGVTGLAAMALAFWIARRVSLPLQELTEGAQQIAAGAYGHKVYAVGRDEIGALGSAFNHMSERLEDQFTQLEEDRQQLRTILSGMVEGVIALDAEQRVLFANDCAADLLELHPQTAAGRKLWEVVRQRPLQEVVQRALRQAEPCRQELSWNGPVTRSLTVHAARLPGAPPKGVVLVLHDTSELRRLERLRQEFVANVSHELKTPLSVIKACVETLLEGAVDDPQHRGRFLEQLTEQSERLHALILDLLSLARIESGTEAFEFESVPLAPAVASCLERHTARAEGKGQSLEIVPPRDGPSADGAAAWADAEAVGQILDNLVDNAVKYTPPGGTIRVRWHGQQDQVCLEVEDTGIGIPEHDLPRIFERFYRVDKARSRQLGGTGLGLSIVKHLIQAMQGTIRARSEPGKGTCFTVCLPRAGASRP